MELTATTINQQEVPKLSRRMVIFWWGILCWVVLTETSRSVSNIFSSTNFEMEQNKNTNDSQNIVKIPKEVQIKIDHYNNRWYLKYRYGRNYLISKESAKLIYVNWSFRIFELWNGKTHLLNDFKISNAKEVE